jgi:ABC-type phosphate transport system substrate-binding protein
MPGGEMKTLIAIVCAALLLSFAQADALSLGEYGSSEGDTLELFASGSSAQDNALQRLFRILCAPKSLDVYHTANGEVRLLFCRSRTGTGAIPGLPAGQKIAFHKSSVSGSGAGVGPLIQRRTVEFLNVADLRAHLDERCPRAKRSVHPPEGELVAYRDYECINLVPAMEVPDAGISDVEPRFFLDAYRLAPEAVEQISAHNSYAFIFGIPVSLGLRDALQEARFPRANPCNPHNPHYTDPVSIDRKTTVPRGETEECMPSLSRTQIASIFAGTLTSWSQIVNPRGYPLAEHSEGGVVRSPPGVHPPSDDQVYICRRVDTSGTQASYEMFFLNQRCTSGIPPFVNSGSNVFLGSVTGDVKVCLTNLDERGIWAVGIMSTDNVESLKRDRWRFIKMDGVAPTLFNTYSGRWPFFVEQSYQWRNGHSAQPLQGPKLTLMAYIGLELANRSIIRDLDRGFRHAWGSAGLMAISNSRLVLPPQSQPDKPVTASMVDENPVLAVRHQSNNCSAVVAEYPTALP